MKALAMISPLLLIDLLSAHEPVIDDGPFSDFDDDDVEPTDDPEVDRLINCARNEWEVQGTLCTHTYIALSNAGVNPEAIIETFNNGGNA